ncbi:hypothetical protein BJX62DRAFT_145125 [Aspergillus germanicus]
MSLEAPDFPRSRPEERIYVARPRVGALSWQRISRQLCRIRHLTYRLLTQDSVTWNSDVWKSIVNLLLSENLSFSGTEYLQVLSLAIIMDCFRIHCSRVGGHTDYQFWLLPGPVVTSTTNLSYTGYASHRTISIFQPLISSDASNNRDEVYIVDQLAVGQCFR